MRAGSGRRVVDRSGAAETPQLAGMAGDDPLTPRRCEPVPAVTWSLDREQPRRRSLSGMAGDDPPTPSWREPVPAVAWSLDRKRPRRRSSQAWPAMIRTTFPRVSKMGLSGLFFDVLPPFLSPFSYNSLIYFSKLYFFTNYSRVFGPILCDLLPAPPFALLLVAVAVLFSRSPLLSMSRSFPLLSSKFGPFSRCFGAVLWHPCRMIPNFGGRIRKNSVKTGVFGAKIRKNAAKPPEKLGKIRFVSPRWHALTI